MTLQELSALVQEVKQLESERARIDDRAAYVGVRLMDTYPVGEKRPEIVDALLNDIDSLL